MLLLSISAAIGAIKSALKARTLSRSRSAVSPRSKLSVGMSLGIILGAPRRPRALVAVSWLAPRQGCRKPVSAGWAGVAAGYSNSEARPRFGQLPRKAGAGGPATNRQ